MSDSNEEDAPTYLPSVDAIGAVLVKKVDRGKSLSEEEATMLVRLAMVEQLERIASSLEVGVQAIQVQAQSIGAHLYQLHKDDQPKTEQGGSGDEDTTGHDPGE